MHELLSKRWEKRSKGDAGFTLIELLVVVVILGVLIAIAIPLYLNYRKGANDASAQSDMRNAINVLEQCNTDNGKYPTLTTPFAIVSGAAVGDCAAQKINLSTGTSMTYIINGAGVGYTLTDQNTNGTSKVYCYDSTKGGPVKSGATAMGASVCS